MLFIRIGLPSSGLYIAFFEKNALFHFSKTDEKSTTGLTTGFAIIMVVFNEREKLAITINE